MNKSLYLECASGISGDMFVAALLDLGADQEKLKRTLGSIQAEGAEIIISRVKKSGLDVCDFLVKLDEEHENHDHDMEYLHGHEHHSHEGHEHTHSHEYEHDGHVHDYGHHSHERHEHDRIHDHDRDAHNHGHHGHTHDHDSHVHDHRHHSHEEHVHTHDHNVHGHDHVHRGLPEILEILRNSSMTEGALEIAERIFRILAEAEAKAHGVPLEQVHFHEVGAIDSIMDIAAAAICLDDLNVDRVYIPELTEGSGTIRCQHGILPVPVPAVSNIAAAWALPVRKTEVRGELITPTGAAIAAAVRTEEPLPEHFVIEQVGMGAGKREYETPGFLRAMLIREREEEKKPVPGEQICKLETDVDDCTGEVLGHVMNLLLEAGAKDVHYTPVYMKKNRPAAEITVICSPEQTDQMEGILFRETTTIGIRRCLMERTVLERSFEKKETPWGSVTMKVCRIPGTEKPRKYVEFSEAERLAEKTGLPLIEICRFLEE